jgi:hypothetical protein
MRIKFSRINFESECAYDVINGRGFLISDTPFSDIDKSIRTMDGPRSPRYGTTYGDANEFMDRYHCKCGKYIGATFEGEKCPECNTVIEYKDVDILYTGWLNFYPYKIINPLYYQRLQSALSKKNLENIISNENIITSSGVIRKHSDSIEVKKSMLTYHNIGLKEFYDNFEEIMLYYKQKRKQKADLIDSLIKDKEFVWTSKLPVYSTVLRPQGITVESYYFSPLDKQIHPLTNISLNLKKASPIEIPLYLYQAQMRANELWALNFSLIDGKHGWARANVLGGQFNYSGRNVIVLDPTLKIDEVDMSYKSFIVKFSGLIIKKIIKDKGWTITRAHNFLKSKFMYDEYVHGLMEEIIHEREVKIILNRNPTITFGSILLMKIRRIKPDSDDMTLAIPSAILPGLNADFDGDELNSIALNLEELESFFKGFSPVNMLINRTDQTIKLDISALENVSLAIFSDR